MWDKLLKILVKEKLSGNSTSFFALTKYKLLIYLLSSLLPCFIVILVLVIVLLGPVLMARQYFEDKKTDQPLLFEKEGDVLSLYGWCDENDENCDRGAEQKYYEQLNKTYDKYKNNGVELDTDLITGTIFYGNTITDDKFEGEDISDSSDLTDDDKLHLSDINNLASNMVSGNRIDYKKYREYLINTYIPKRFKSYYEDDVGKEQIADEIMGFSSLEVETNNYAYSTLGVECSSISLKDRSGNITVHELEEYVAGVVQAENGGAGLEARKLQAIAARSFAVKNCDRVIVNSIGDVMVDGRIDQAYTTPTDSSWEATKATEGQILTYNGDVMTISFASYPKANYRGGFPTYEKLGYLCSDVNCSTGADGRQWCTTTTYKQPNMEKFDLYMPDTKTSGYTWNGLHLNNQGGHCYGISQVASAYYEEELNYTYEQMVEEFLSPGVEIVSITSGIAEGGTLVAYNNNQYFTRTSQPEANNKYFFSNLNSSYSGGFTGQCTWYAFGRANEVLGTVGSELKWTIWDDAGKWYNLNIQNGKNAFEYNSDATKPRPGSIIVWGQKGSWGHVAFVEKVNDDGTLDYSEANIRDEKSASNPYGWRYMANQSFEQVKNLWAGSGYYFQGYIYMLK